MDTETDGGGQDFAPEIDFSSVGVQEVQEASASPAPADNSGGNPAWAPILEKVPAGYHDLIKPQLEEWDKNVQKRFQSIHQEYEPFKPLKEQNLDPQGLLQAHTIRQQIDSDPVGFYNRLGGFLRQAGYLEEAEEAEAIAADMDEEDEGGQDPRLVQLERQQQELIQRLEQEAQQRQMQEMQQRANEQVRSEYQQVEAKYGQLSETMRQELFQRATLMTDLAVKQGKEPPSLMEAMDSLQNFVSQVRSARPAPRVVPGSGGGIPAPQASKPVADMTESERKAHAAQIIDSVLGNN